MWVVSWGGRKRGRWSPEGVSEPLRVFLVTRFAIQASGTTSVFKTQSNLRIFLTKDIKNKSKSFPEAKSITLLRARAALCWPFSLTNNSITHAFHTFYYVLLVHSFFCNKRNHLFNQETHWSGLGSYRNPQCVVIVWSIMPNNSVFHRKMKSKLYAKVGIFNNRIIFRLHQKIQPNEMNYIPSSSDVKNELHSRIKNIPAVLRK